MDYEKESKFSKYFSVYMTELRGVRLGSSREKIKMFLLWPFQFVWFIVISLWCLLFRFLRK